MQSDGYKAYHRRLHNAVVDMVNAKASTLSHKFNYLSEATATTINTIPYDIIRSITDDMITAIRSLSESDTLFNDLLTRWMSYVPETLTLEAVDSILYYVTRSDFIQQYVIHASVEFEYQQK